jgi:hypothetical protein
MVRVVPYTKRGKKGWEYDIRGVRPDGRPYRERRKSPRSSYSATLRYAQQREAVLLSQRDDDEVVKAAPPPTVEEFSKEFLTYSKTNNKPSTVHAKEWMLRVHLLPFFGSMRLDEIGPADVEKYKAKKLEEGQSKKSINNHLTALRKLLNLAVE